MAELMDMEIGEHIASGLIVALFILLFLREYYRFAPAKENTIVPVANAALITKLNSGELLKDLYNLCASTEPLEPFYLLLDVKGDFDISPYLPKEVSNIIRILVHSEENNIIMENTVPQNGDKIDIDSVKVVSKVEKILGISEVIEHNHLPEFSTIIISSKNRTSYYIVADNDREFRITLPESPSISTHINKLISIEYARYFSSKTHIRREDPTFKDDKGHINIVQHQNNAEKPSNQGVKSRV